MPKIPRIKRRSPSVPPERGADGTFGAPDPSAPPKRRGNPAWRKGGSSPNPGGQPKAVKLIRDRIGEVTRDGGDIIKFFVDAMSGRDAGADDPKVRLAAAEWLGAHYFGKPKQELGVSVEITVEQRAMLEALKLSPHERRGRIAELKARATAELIDVPALPESTDADTD